MTDSLDITPVIAQQSNMHNMLLVLGIALVTTSLLMMYRRRRAKRVTRITPHEQIERIKQQRGMRGDLETLMVEIEELARRFGAQLDAKTVELERLLGEADQRIKQLQQMGGQPQPKTDGSSVPVQDAEPAASNLRFPGSQGTDQTQPDDPLARSVYDLADQGLGPHDIAQKLDELVGKIELILALRNA